MPFKFFKRAKATLTIPEHVTPAPNGVEPKQSPLDAFREEWEAAQEVIEGDGGDAEWDKWTEAVENEKRFFASTVPMPLGPN